LSTAAPKVIRLGDVIITLLIAAAGAAALLAPFINPQTNWLYAFFALFFPWIYLLNAIAAAYWLVRILTGKTTRRWTILFPLIILVLGWFSPGRIIRHHAGRRPANNQPVIRLLTYNTHSLQEMFRDNTEDDFRQFIRREHPDILFLQETNPKIARYIRARLGYGHIVRNDKFIPSTTIISRYPILASGAANFYKSGNGYAWADIEVRGRRLRFYSVFLQSNAISTETKHLADESDLNSKKTWWRLRRILALYRMTARQRAQQAREVKLHAMQSPYPVFFAGDFNDQPLAYSYRLLAENKKDSFVEAGSGTGTTYPGLGLNLRIDYVLTPPDFIILKHRIPAVPFSDHYPVVVDIAWQP